MSRSVRPFGLLAAFTTLVIGLSSQASATLTTVYSNNPSPGDSVSGFSFSPTFGNNVAIGSTGWRYTDVQTASTKVGISSANPFNGNGSVSFNTTTSTGKADISYTSLTPLGQLKDLNALSYSWFRDSSSTVAAWLAPSIRLMIRDNQGHSGSLVWEPVYNGYPTAGPAVPTNTWTLSDAFNGGNGVFWTTGSTLPGAPGNQYLTFNNWIDPSGTMKIGDYYVYGISSGVGSGWTGNFTGAVDNITIGFTGNDPTTYNFEVQAVPEPTNVALGLIAGGLTLVAAARRRFGRA